MAKEIIDGRVVRISVDRLDQPTSIDEQAEWLIACLTQGDIDGYLRRLIERSKASA